MATKSYFVGPQDGWFKIVTAGLFASLRVSANPFTHPFFIYGDATATPTLAADNGVYVCHHPFKITAGDRKNADAFWVRIKNPVPNSSHSDGRIRIDVYTDGGTLV